MNQFFKYEDFILNRIKLNQNSSSIFIEVSNGEEAITTLECLSFCDFHIKLDMDDSSDEFFPTFVPLLSISQQDSSKRFHIHLEGGDLEIDIVCKRIVSSSEDFWSKNKL